MPDIDQLRVLAARILNSPHATNEEREEAFRARDIANVASMDYSPEQLAELEYEARAGCYGNDSEFHTYFGL